MNLKETFEKQGGIKLLKQYCYSGAFFTALGEFLLLGKSRTALEILRLSTQLKVKQKLEKKYRKELLTFDANWGGRIAHTRWSIACPIRFGFAGFRGWRMRRH